MMGWPTNDAPGSFWTTPVDGGRRPAGRADASSYRPDVVVTYDANGFYGHPDHIQAHRITMAALERTGVAGEGLLDDGAALGHGEVRPDDAREAGHGRPGRGRAAGRRCPTIGLPDDEITTWVDVAAFARQKFAALGAHASQEETMPFLQHGRRALRRRSWASETFVRVARHAPARRCPGTDLFAGLR